MKKNEQLEKDFEEAHRLYGDYETLELRKEAELMENLARGTKDEQQMTSYRRQAYLLNLLIHLTGTRV